MSQLAELLVNALTTLFVGATPDRPPWLRRLVQAFWLLSAALIVVAWVAGVLLLIRSL
jgi:hypothetical protein